MTIHKLSILIVTLLLSGCFADTKLTFDIVATGFKNVKLEDLSVSCYSANSTTGYSGDLNVTKRVLGRVKMTADIEVPKDTSLSCALGGDEFTQLSFIPVYHNSKKSRYFRVLEPTTLKVRIHRKSTSVEGETYANVTFRRIDHIHNKKIVVEKNNGRAIASEDEEDDGNWLE